MLLIRKYFFGSESGRFINYGSYLDIFVAIEQKYVLKFK
jgi:hypothetical protein